jgi:hypothetical protein
MGTILKAIGAFLLIILCGAAGVAAATLFQYYFTNTGTITTPSLTVKWLNGTDVTQLGWLATENATEYTYLEPINITNTGNTPITLSIGYENPSSSILTLTVGWNYTGTPLAQGASVILEIYQNVTATGPYSYTTKITGTP